MTVFPVYTMKRAKAPQSPLTSVLKAGDKFTLQTLNNRKMSHRYPVNSRLWGPHIRSDLSGERNNSACSMVTIRTELSRFFSKLQSKLRSSICQ